jgi:uncharacterized protein (TIGR03000 family)
MYSVVLMAAVVAGGESADFGRRGCGCWGGCRGCYGCFGGCYGCGGGWGCRGGWRRGCGGCYGCGGWGGCYGGCGGVVYGCGGVVYGGGCWGGCGGVVMGYAPPMAGVRVIGGGRRVITGGGAATGSGRKVIEGGREQTAGGGGKGTIKKTISRSAGSVFAKDPLKGGRALNAQGAGRAPNDTRAGRKATYVSFRKGRSDEGLTSSGPARTTLEVRVPAGARLTVDGRELRSTSTVRTFQTPELAPGKRFYYDFEATFTRGGEPVTVRKRVVVAAGQSVRVDLRTPPVAVAGR